MNTQEHDCDNRPYNQIPLKVSKITNIEALLTIVIKKRNTKDSQKMLLFSTCFNLVM